MTTTLGCDEPKSILRQHVDLLPDYCKPGPNTRYKLPDAALGAFGAFFTQSPSFLDFQRHLQKTKGRNNALALLDVEAVPCNNQIRNRLDPITPNDLDGVFLDVFDGLLTAYFEKWTFDLPIHKRDSSRWPIFEAKVNGFALILQLHGLKAVDDLHHQAPLRQG